MKRLFDLSNLLLRSRSIGRRTNKPGQRRKQVFPQYAEVLETRCLLSAVLGFQIEGTNWSDPSLPRGHNKHVDHATWDANPTTDGIVTVTVLVHNHDGNLNGDKMARMNDAIAEVNSAAVGGTAVNLNLVTVTVLSQFHNIHLHENSTSPCGSGALGCAASATYINQSGKFGDGHGNHLYAGEEVKNIGGRAEATILSGFNWYTDSGLSIGLTEYDYQTVVTQELLHLVGGLDHDDTVYDNDLEEVSDNTDHRSVMHGSLAQGMVRRFMSTHDQEVLTHLYGPGQTTDDGGDGGGGKGGGPPAGKGKNKLAGSVAGSLAENSSDTTPIFFVTGTTAAAETDSANDDVAADDVVISVVAVADWNSEETGETTEDDATEETKPVAVSSQDLDELFTGLPSDELLADVI